MLTRRLLLQRLAATPLLGLLAVPRPIAPPIPPPALPVEPAARAFPAPLVCVEPTTEYIDHFGAIARYAGDGDMLVWDGVGGWQPVPGNEA